MIKKIDILGIWLDNYTVREAIRQVETYLDNHVLNAIESITMQMLVDSENDPVLKEALSCLDLALIGEKEIFQAVGIGTMQRIRETEENDFFYEFFKRVERNKKSVFLLGETDDEIGRMKNRLLEEFPKIIFAGDYAVENCVGDLEAVINDMNATTPNIIISILPTPMQEHFFMEHRDKMNANIWYGMGILGLEKKKHNFGGVFRSILYRGRLKNSIAKYREKGTGQESAETEVKDEAQ